MSWKHNDQETLYPPNPRFRWTKDALEVLSQKGGIEQNAAAHIQEQARVITQLNKDLDLSETRCRTMALEIGRLQKHIKQFEVVMK